MPYIFVSLDFNNFDLIPLSMSFICITNNSGQLLTLVVVHRKLCQSELMTINDHCLPRASFESTVRSHYQYHVQFGN